MKKAYFTTVNSGIYIDPISAGERPRNPNATGGVTIRSAIKAAVGVTCITTMAPTIDLFEVQETICQLIHDQKTYKTW